MVNYLSSLVFVILLLIGAALVIPIGLGHPIPAVVLGAVWLLGDVILSSAIQMAAQWEREVVFRLGRFRNVRGPGVFLIAPLIDQFRRGPSRPMSRRTPRTGASRSWASGWKTSTCPKS